ncbi:hypothetical protein CLV51_1083 [Chitinophaga niastensis]|uniref:Uncharacterized protein n=1 Tax=Chitinophaga niastensis TaxID=536980 RepID=A0A2P8HAS5_CHINA|nr:hypothetical protein [Chitinophaga niastensis]PSL43314.1 hypothetical protein CLV51_1083 [Chitinophaga niastensis]
MKKIKILYGLLLLSAPIYSQNASSSIYQYKSSHYYESIDLLNDGTFKYYQKTEFTKSEINGNWQLRHDSILVLDSSPQKTKLKVSESYKKNRKVTFRIRDMKNDLIYYNIYLLTNEGDSLVFKDQFDKTTATGKFSSFYIVDTKGLHSPVYNINGVRTNFFDISVEQQRVFENEHWKHCDQYIVPLGLNGKYSDYKLVKQ